MVRTELVDAEEVAYRRSFFLLVVGLVVVGLVGCADELGGSSPSSDAPLANTPAPGDSTATPALNDHNANFGTSIGNTFSHDPAIIKAQGQWYQFFTGLGIQVAQSTNGHQWEEGPQVFSEPLAWWEDYVPDQDPNDVWAPDIAHYQGRYWLYYSVSSFGSNTSAIGLASTEDITSGSWTDEGLVIRSTSSDNFNAIDPNLVIDEDGDPWLAFGSFWSGLKVTALDPSTMKPADGPLHAIAAWPQEDNAIENPFITFRDGYYYLFASVGECCQGVNSTYRIVVGRSSSITGPYVGKDGTDMMDGGGTIFDNGNDRWIGPGGQSLFNNRVLARHAYDAEDDGTPKLLVTDLFWDASGWPTYEAQSREALESGTTYELLNPNSSKVLEAAGMGTEDGTNVQIWDDQDQVNQRWTLYENDDGTYRLIGVQSGKALDVEGAGTSDGTNVHLWTYLGGENQHWDILDNGDDTFRLIDVNSGKALDVNEFGTSNGTNVQIWADFENGAQQWQFNRY